MTLLCFTSSTIGLFMDPSSPLQKRLNDGLFSHHFPKPAFANYLCLFLLTAWADFNLQSS